MVPFLLIPNDRHQRSATNEGAFMVPFSANHKIIKSKISRSCVLGTPLSLNEYHNRLNSRKRVEKRALRSTN